MESLSSAKGLDSEKGSMNVEASRVSLFLLLLPPNPPVPDPPAAKRSETDPVGDVIWGRARIATLAGNCWMG